MGLFSKNKKERLSVAIIGCNRSGIALAESLSSQGFETYIVDKSAKAFERISSAYTGNVVLGDVMDEKIANEDFLKNTQVIFVLTASDNKNILISQSLQNKFGDKKRIISRLNDSVRASAYAAFDMENISVENIFANSVAHNLCYSADGETT